MEAAPCQAVAHSPTLCERHWACKLIPGGRGGGVGGGSWVKCLSEVLLGALSWELV